MKTEKEEKPDLSPIINFLEKTLETLKAHPKPETEEEIDNLLGKIIRKNTQPGEPRFQALQGTDEIDAFRAIFSLPKNTAQKVISVSNSLKELSNKKNQKDLILKLGDITKRMEEVLKEIKEIINPEKESEKLTGEDLFSLIKGLKQYDNEEGYKLSYDKVKKKLENTTKKLIEYGKECLEELHPLLEKEETWSCTFALEILKQIKSEKSIPFLIDFIKNNEHGDYWENCDDALWALKAIGKPAITPLLDEIKPNFVEKKYYAYLIGALTGIKDEKVYSFMLETLKDYLENTEKYDEWFGIDHFVYNFEVQGKKEVLPLLKELLAKEHLSEFERREISSTIEVVEDPEEFHRKMKVIGTVFKDSSDLKKEDINQKELLEQAVDFEEKKEYNKALEITRKILAVYPDSYCALFLTARVKRKLGKPDTLTLNRAWEEAKKQKAGEELLKVMREETKKIKGLYQELESTPDEDLELNFRCRKCGKRQNLKPGLIWEIERDEVRDEIFLFENEIMCKYCFDHGLELTGEGKRRIWSQGMRMFMGEARGILQIDKKVYVLNKKMSFKKTYPYLLKRIDKNPHQGELYLRAGNIARKENKYEEAIKHYQKAIELAPKLIAVYFNLVEIYKYRAEYYKIKEAKDKAIHYLKTMRELHNSKDYSKVTIPDFQSIIQFIRENEFYLGLSSDYKKLSEPELAKTLKKGATLDVEAVSKKMKEKAALSREEAERLLEENKAIKVFQTYHILDEKTKENKRMDLSSIEPVDPSKLCICGSEKYLKDCCFEHVLEERTFVANIDYETYSLLESKEKEIEIKENYNGLVRGFKEDIRFYCEDETKEGALFLYFGDNFFTHRGLGTVVFGTMEIRRAFDGKAQVKIEALSKNRFDSLNRTVGDHVEE